MKPISCTRKKANKEEAFEIVKRLRDGEHVHDSELESLLLYFAPSPGTKPKTSFAWVSKATGRNATLQHFCHVRVEHGKIVASDGFRLHIADNPGLEEGWYKPGKEPILTNGDFRCYDWQSIMKEVDNAEWEQVDYNAIVTKIVGNNFVVKLKDNCWIKKNSFEQAQIDKFWFDEDGGRVFFRNQFGEGVIMCYKVDENEM